MNVNQYMKNMDKDHKNGFIESVHLMYNRMLYAVVEHIIGLYV